MPSLILILFPIPVHLGYVRLPESLPPVFIQAFLPHNLLFFSLVLYLSIMAPLSFLLIYFHIFLQGFVHKLCVTFLSVSSNLLHFAWTTESLSPLSLSNIIFNPSSLNHFKLTHLWLYFQFCVYAITCKRSWIPRLTRSRFIHTHSWPSRFTSKDWISLLPQGNHWLV